MRDIHRISSSIERRMGPQLRICVLKFCMAEVDILKFEVADLASPAPLLELCTDNSATSDIFDESEVSAKVR